MKIHKMKQLSDEWFAVKNGKMSASNAQAIATNGKGLKTYIYKLLAEKYSNNDEEYTNADIERGMELEEQARMTYEIETGEKVDEVGFIEIDDHLGCSPDGLIGKDGGLEIKCVNNTNFFKLLVDGEDAIESKYLWQVQMSLLLTGRKYWNLAFYNVNFDKNLLVFRIEPDEKKQEKLKKGIDAGKELIKDLENKFNQ